MVTCFSLMSKANNGGGYREEVALNIKNQGRGVRGVPDVFYNER